MMNEMSMEVVSVTKKDAEETTYTVVLKGTKTIAHDCGGGFEMEDATEISLTVKCKLLDTLVHLGISQPGAGKIVSLRDRDMVLQSFGELEPVEAAQQEIV